MKESYNAEVPESKACATFIARKCNSQVGDTGERSLQAREMRFLRNVSGYRRENKERNGDIRDK